MSYNAPTAAAAPNWYSDPSNPSQERYWDGYAWTGHVRPAASAWSQLAPAQPPAASAGNGLSVAGIIFGVLSFFFFPIVFGPIGLILGAVAKNKGEAKANLALVVAGIGTVAGMLLGAMFAVATL